MLPQSFFRRNTNAFASGNVISAADALFGEDIPKDILLQIVYETLSFDILSCMLKDNIYALELFHGPTLAFKEVGAASWLGCWVILSAKSLKQW